MLLEENAIGQVCERIVSCEVLYSRPLPALFANILMSGDPAAVSHRLVANENRPAIRHFDVERAWLIFRGDLEPLIEEHVGAPDAANCRLRAVFAEPRQAPFPA